jgi:hypothetical protein
VYPYFLAPVRRALFNGLVDKIIANRVASRYFFSRRICENCGIQWRGEEIDRMRAKWLLPVVLGFFLTGCAAVAFFGVGAAAGVASIKYYQGALTVVLDAPFIDTWDARLKALEDLKFRVEKSDHDLTSGKIHAKGADAKDVSISLKYKSAKQTEALIRVGVFGDEGASMAIKERIRRILVKE